MTPQQQAAAVRRGAGVFRLPERGVLEVAGGDRVRWLDGMLTSDVSELARCGPGAGRYALLLTPQGRVVADFHVLLRQEGIWLETEASAIPGVVGHLEKYVVADDVMLWDRSPELARLAVEGPAARGLLPEVLGDDCLPEPEHGVDVTFAGFPLLVIAFALSGGDGFQVVASRDGEDVVRTELLRLGEPLGVVSASASALEILRIESGVPRLGPDLDESVLPDEARLEQAVSTTKGCYTGQEVVARMRSRGRISHRLVGLRCADEALPSPGASLSLDGKPVGEVTSAALSPTLGAIALGYVRVPHDAPDTELELPGGRVRVAELPFLDPPRGR